LFDKLSVVDAKRKRPLRTKAQEVKINERQMYLKEGAALLALLGENISKGDYWSGEIYDANLGAASMPRSLTHIPVVPHLAFGRAQPFH